MSLFDELKRRNVIRMAALYLLAAWLIVQVAKHGFVLAHNGLGRRAIEMSAPDDTPNT